MRKIDFKTESSVVNKIRSILKENIEIDKENEYQNRLNLLLGYIYNEGYIIAMISEESSKFKRSVFNILSLCNLDDKCFKDKLDNKIQDLINYHSGRIIILCKNLIQKVYENNEENSSNLYLIYIESIIKTFLEGMVTIIHIYIQEEDYEAYRERLVFLYYTSIEEIAGLYYPEGFFDDEGVMDKILESLVTDEDQEELKEYLEEEE